MLLCLSRWNLQRYLVLQRAKRNEIGEKTRLLLTPFSAGVEDKALFESYFQRIFDEVAEATNLTIPSATGDFNIPIEWVCVVDMATAWELFGIDSKKASCLFCAIPSGLRGADEEFDKHPTWSRPWNMADQVSLSISVFYCLTLN
jgi:hypothetical protein